MDHTRIGQEDTRRLQAVFGETFRFRIGDLVCWDRTLQALHVELEVNGPVETGRYATHRLGAPFGLRVVARQIEECHGAIQCHYFLAGLDDAKTNISRRIAAYEFELCPWEEVANVVRDMIVRPKRDESEK